MHICFVTLQIIHGKKITYVKIYQNQASLTLFHALLTLRKALNIGKNISGLTQKLFLTQAVSSRSKVEKMDTHTKINIGFGET